VILVRAVLVALLTLVALGCERIESRMIQRAAERGAAAPDHSDWLTDGALHVVLCGTGSPLPSKLRAGPCTAVIAGGHFLLVDTGPGANYRMGLLALPRQSLDAVLLTHFHSDHIGELGETAMQSWALGRKQPLPVYGPPGVEDVVAGFEGAYAYDTLYRIAHHGADFMPADARKLVAHPLPLDASDEGVVLEDGDLRVTAFRVDHAPVAPAYGYRIDYKGRSVVISGDTKPSPNVEKHAKDVDLLLHEALATHLVLAGRDAAAKAGLARRAKLAGDIPGYHTTPVQAAELGKRAGAHLTVLTHLVPPPDGVFARRIFMDGVAAANPNVLLGEDGMHFRLAPGDEEVPHETLE
jgi:ribonuclease Z